MRQRYFKLSDAESYVPSPGMGNKDKKMLVDEILKDWRPHPSNASRFRNRVENLLDVAMKDAEDQNKDCDKDNEPVIGGVIASAENMRQWATGRTFVFTSAQANTILNDNFWASLMALVEDRQAQLHISRFTYNKQRFGKNSVKPGSYDDSDSEEIWFDPRIAPYVSDEQIQIAEDLIWCGELNIIPTRADPISGFENYGRGDSVIIPHTRMAMKSVPVMKHSCFRFCYTTGTVTARNYIEKAAGQKASLHHVYGALLVEVDDDGEWWSRQINSDEEGTIYDLTDMFTCDGSVHRALPVEAITHGDLHGNKIDQDVLSSMTRIGGIIDYLRPRHQIFHDTVDFQPRNHHNINDPHFRHQMSAEGIESVKEEFDFTAGVLTQFMRTYSQQWLVTSNHDQAIECWLKNTDGFHDPVNHMFWLEMNLYCANRRKEGLLPKPFAEAIGTALRRDRQHFHVIHEDDSLIIAGIENGLHGHLGPNGARGNPKNLRSVGKANTGHTHSAGIVDGVYTAGVFANLDMGYNKGMSSWSHSFIVTYPNGKRTILTIKNGKAWR